MLRIPRHDRTVVVARHQEVLGLHADLEDVALCPRLGQDTLEVGARAVRIGFAVHEQVADEAGRVGLPGNRCIAVRIDAGHHVMRVRTLAEAQNRGAGKPGPLINRVVVASDRDHLHFRGAGHVDKLHEQKLDPVLL